jgi:hypothetical protein
MLGKGEKNAMVSQVHADQYNIHIGDFILLKKHANLQAVLANVHLTHAWLLNLAVITLKTDLKSNVMTQI